MTHLLAVLLAAHGHSWLQEVVDAVWTVIQLADGALDAVWVSSWWLG